jgi:PAS domain S-box-containing protein
MSTGRTVPALRVLLVDDDEVPRMLTAEALFQCDFEVFEAASGAEALELFPLVQPDIVLLDMVMPDIDGFRVCARLRAMPSGSEIPILVMTGLDDNRSIDLAYEVGATDFVTKPINLVLLGHRLRYLTRAATAFSVARENAARLAHAQHLARLAQWEVDPETKAFRWSEEAATLFGFSTEALEVDRALLRHVHGADRERVAKVFEQAKPHTIEYRVLLDSNRECVIRQEAALVLDPKSGHELLHGTAQDITQLRDAERQVHDLAYFDSLTRLPNRAQLRRFLERSLVAAHLAGRSLAVLTLDLDGFKAVNDSLGHAGGDELLCEVAKRLTSSVRGTDTVVCATDGPTNDPETHFMAARLGGDEFVMVLDDIQHQGDVAAVAQRIVDRLAGTYTIGRTEVFVSSSIGVAMYPTDATTVETLLDRADIAMYKAKHSGRNQYQFFVPSMEEAARGRLEIERSLRAALHRTNVHNGTTASPSDGSEFHLVYQPKVELPSGSVLGVEALLRWTSRELGAMSPADFVPIAEDTGLIVPLGAWVLRTACARAKAWSQGRQPALRVAVNVSARQFREPGFAALVAEVLAATELDPSLLELEITEGILMDDTAASKRMLDGLKALGVRIALDDFGTGYSSLSYLTKLPIDSLKIDRSFIRAVGGDGGGETITAAIIALSRSLGIDVVVEGVECEEQLAFVTRQEGSVEVQGFFFARPMAPGKIDEWREEHESRHGAPRSLVA